MCIHKHSKKEKNIFCVEISHAIVMMISISGFKYAACRIRILKPWKHFTPRTIRRFKWEILMRVGRWLVGWLVAAGKLKRINNRNNDDDRRKKAKYVVLSMDYLGTSYFVCMRCSVLLRCVLYYLLFHLYWVLSLACLFACRLFDGDTHFSLLHTQKHTHTYTYRHRQAKTYLHLVNTQRRHR